MLTIGVDDLILKLSFEIGINNILCLTGPSKIVSIYWRGEQIGIRGMLETI